MSTSPESGPVFGHVSPPADDSHFNFTNDTESTSDLSDVNAAEADPNDDADAQSYQPADEAVSPIQKPELTLEEASDSASDNDVSDDGDFDAPDSPRSAQSNEVVSASSSRTVVKRKVAHATEDDYIRENPALYGLRRSVRISRILVVLYHANDLQQSRPTQRRAQIVSGSR